MDSHRKEGRCFRGESLLEILAAWLRTIKRIKQLSKMTLVVLIEEAVVVFLSPCV